MFSQNVLDVELSFILTSGCNMDLMLFWEISLQARWTLDTQTGKLTGCVTEA